MSMSNVTRLYRIGRGLRQNGRGLRRIGPEDQLTVVAHLDELRTRLFVSLAAVAVAFGLCFWQNQRLLHVIDQPLAHATQQAVRSGQGPLGATYSVQRSTRDVAVQLHAVLGALSAEPHDAPLRGALRQAQARLSRDIARLSAPPAGDKPITLGIGEPFTTTVTVSLIFALILSLPVLLWQALGFLMPALDERQQRAVMPMALAVPALFVGGVAFGYFIVLPAAVHFFQTFNSNQFNVLVQANQYYKFAATTLLAMGLIFQLPVAILAVTRAGVVSAGQLRRNRRYALAACALVAAALPGDAITMFLETAPLYLLFELSVLLAGISERRRATDALKLHPQPNP
jgi:sec-independent protein translocase protein TatC